MEFIPFSELGTEVALSHFPVALLRKREDAGQEALGAKIPSGSRVWAELLHLHSHHCETHVCQSCSCDCVISGKRVLCVLNRQIWGEKLYSWL